MDATQLYETTIYNREGSTGFTLVTVPGRSFADGIQSTDALAVAEQLGLRDPRFGDGDAIRITPVEAWALPFLIDSALGRTAHAPDWPIDPFFPERYLRGGGRRAPSQFSQYLAYASVVPFESSPLGPKALSDLLTAGGGVGVALGAYSGGHPLLLIVVPAGIVVCGAATGVAEALRIGLRTKLLKLMGVSDADAKDDGPASD